MGVTDHADVSARFLRLTRRVFTSLLRCCFLVILPAAVHPLLSCRSASGLAIMIVKAVQIWGNEMLKKGLVGIIGEPAITATSGIFSVRLLKHADFAC